MPREGLRQRLRPHGEFRNGEECALALPRLCFQGHLEAVRVLERLFRKSGRSEFSRRFGAPYSRIVQENTGKYMNYYPMIGVGERIVDRNVRTRHVAEPGKSASPV